METVATCSTTDGNSSYHGLAHRLSTRWHVADVKNIAGDDQTTLMVHRNSANIACTFRCYVCLPMRDRDISAADDSGSCHAPAPLYFEEMTRCRRKKFHWRWPGNPNGPLKFRNLGLFTFTRSQLMLRRRLRRWWRFPETAQMARNRRQKHRLDDQDRSKFCKYENVCLRDQAKRLEKLLFAATNAAAIDSIVQCFFSAITRNGFCFHLRKIISSRPWPPTKNWDIHIVEFFVDSIYNKTILAEKKIIFLDGGPVCKVGDPDNDALLHVAFYPGLRITAPFYK